jgi:hypothetical protein
MLAATSAVLHAASLGHMVGQGPFVIALMVAMIFGCLYCARHLWTRAAPGDWAVVAVMSLGMLALHTPMSSGSAHHVHSGVSTLAAGVAAVPDAHAAMPLMTAAVMIAAVEAAIATISLIIATNLRNRSLFQAA